MSTIIMYTPHSWEPKRQHHRWFIPERPSRSPWQCPFLPPKQPSPIINKYKYQMGREIFLFLSCQGQMVSLSPQSPAHGFPTLWHSGSQAEIDFLYQHLLSSPIHSKTILTVICRLSIYICVRDNGRNGDNSMSAQTYTRAYAHTNTYGYTHDTHKDMNIHVHPCS